MGQALADLARALVGTPINKLALYLMIDVPGFAPIVQTAHLLSIAAVMGSIVLFDLRVLGLALPSQSTTELTRRLMPWTWGHFRASPSPDWSLSLRDPIANLVNPVFGMKLAMLASAMILSVVLQRATAKDVSFWERSRGRHALSKTVAAFSLLLWIGVAMAGRWIAYADYLLPPG